MRAKLTRALLDAQVPDPSGRHLFLWDTEVRGLGFLVTKGGHRSFVFQYHHAGRDRRLTLGEHGAELTLHQARQLAGRKRLEVAGGADPAQERNEARRAPTVQDLAARFMDEHAAGRKPATARLYRLAWDQYILPVLGSRPVAAVTWADVAAIHRRMKARPVAANRMLATVSKAWNLARRWGWVPRDAANPGAGHDRFPERRRGQAAGPLELARIGAALRDENGSIPGAAFLVCLLSGARPGEVLRMRWADLDGRLWRLPDAKCGPRTVYLGEVAWKTLTALSRLGEHVFPGLVPGRPLQDLRRLWERVTARAGLPPSMRLYDACRHTFTSTALEVGIPLERVKVLVGHAPDRDVTARYSHLRPDVLLADADRVADHLWRCLEMPPEAAPASNVRAFPATATPPPASTSRSAAGTAKGAAR